MVQPTVSVVIPVRDGSQLIGRVLDALLVQNGIRPQQVIVVDNGSKDDSASVAAAHRIAPIVVNEPTPGSYLARNVGAAFATSDVLAFTDVDCIPAPDWLHEGLTALANSDLVGGAVVPVIRGRRSAWALYDSAFYLRQDQNIYAGFAATANLFVKRDLFEVLGGFDPHFHSGGDHDFGARARAFGATVGYAPDAKVEHTARGSLREVWALQTRIGGGWAALRGAGRRPPIWRDPAHLHPFDEFARVLPDDVQPELRRKFHLIHYVAVTARLAGEVRYAAAHNVSAISRARGRT